MDNEDAATQERVATLASSLATSSMIFAGAAIMIFLDAGSRGWFWMRCIILVATSIAVVALLGKVKQFTWCRRRSTWLITMIYFSGVMALVGLTFESLEAMLIIAMPEAAGFFVALYGFLQCLRHTKLPERKSI